MKKKNFSHGTPEQMLDAFEDKLYELEDGSIEMSTDMEGEFLDDSEYIDDDLYDINGEELDVDIEGSDDFSYQEWRDEGKRRELEYLQETNPYTKEIYTEDPYLEEMVDFLADHPQAEADAKSYFGVEDSDENESTDWFEGIDERELTGWFLDHPQLWNDLQKRLIALHPEEMEERKRREV